MLLCEPQGIHKMYFPLLKLMVKCTYRWTELGVLLKFISIVAPFSLGCIVLVICEESFDRSLVLRCIQKNEPLSCLRKDAGRGNAETRPVGTASAQIPHLSTMFYVLKPVCFLSAAELGKIGGAHSWNKSGSLCMIFFLFPYLSGRFCS